jgi:hypothetical protein
MCSASSAVRTPQVLAESRRFPVVEAREKEVACRQFRGIRDAESSYGGRAMTMMGRTRVITLSVAAAALLLAGTAQAAPQTKEQQVCINAMNKDALKVYVTQGKENVRCASLDRVEDATTDLDTCLLTGSKVSARQTKTLADEGKRCTGVGVPGFGYSSGATINTNAKQIEIDLIEDMFSNPTVDAGMYPCNPYENECRCQRVVQKMVEKLMSQIGNTYNKCKKYALKGDDDPYIPSASDPNDLMDCVDDPTKPLSVAKDERGTLADNKEKILNAIVDGECTNPSMVIEEPFPGPFCNRTALGGTPTNEALRDCLKQRAYCHVCRLINAADDLSVDCAALSGGTCP